MNKFLEKINKICEENKRVAMFIDMDGTINVYNVYPEEIVKQKMQEEYSETEPAQYIIDILKDISKISNIDLYILSLSKSVKITKEKKDWLKKYVPFINEENWIIITKELNEYSSENRDIVKAHKIKDLENKYDYFILLDDDHKILKEAQKIVGKNFSPFHISSVLV
jgi:5'(3')-deoxyribonucleotidase